jgi:Arm DNA-binding domain
MIGSRRGKLGLRDLRSIQPGQTIWDGSVSGFGARRQGGEVISYIVMYRTKEGRQRIYTIGKHGSPWSPEMARREARRVLGEVINGADRMADKIAGRTAVTVAELCGQYLADAEAGRLLTQRKIAKKESTLISDRGRIARHIVPLLGRMPVKTVGRNDVERFMHDVAAGKTAIREKTKPPPASRSYAAVVVSPDAPWHCLARSLPMPCARAFGSTIPCVGSSSSPKVADGDG